MTKRFLVVHSSECETLRPGRSVNRPIRARWSIRPRTAQRTELRVRRTLRPLATLLVAGLALVAVPVVAIVDLVRTPAAAYEGKDLSRRAWLVLIPLSMLGAALGVAVSVVYLVRGRPQANGSGSLKGAVLAVLGAWLVVAALLLLVG